MQGGPNQRRHQNRGNERVFHFARVISDEVIKALREERVEVLVGSDEFMKALVAGTIPMDFQQHLGMNEVIAATAALADEPARDGGLVSQWSLPRGA